MQDQTATVVEHVGGVDQDMDPIAVHEGHVGKVNDDRLSRLDQRP
jgi:hypothetical protein